MEDCFAVPTLGGPFGGTRWGHRCPLHPAATDDERELAMQFRLKTFFLVLCVALAFLGWFVDRGHQARLCQLRCDGLKQEIESLRQDIAARDLNANLLQSIIAARAAKSGSEYEMAVQEVENATTGLAKYGPRGKIAIGSYVSCAKVPWYRGSERQPDLLASQGLSAIGPEVVPDLLKLLQNDNTRVRQNAAQALLILAHPIYEDFAQIRLSNEEAKELVKPIQDLAAKETDFSVRVRLRRFLAWVVNGERHYSE